MAGTRATSTSTGTRLSRPALSVALVLAAIALPPSLTVSLLAPPAQAGKDDDRMRTMQKEAERAMREAQARAREAAKQAERARRQAEREREQAARAAQKAAEAAQKAAKEAAKQAQKAAKTDTQSSKNTAVKTTASNGEDAKKQTDKRDENKRDDDDDDDDARSNVKRAEEIIQTPPRTLVELIGRLTGNEDKASDTRQQVQEQTQKIRGEADTLKATVKNAVAPAAKTIKSAVGDQDNDDGSGNKQGVVGKTKLTGRPVASSGNATRHEFELPSLGGREILAANVANVSLDKLISLGFQTRGASVVGLLNTSVTRLIPPAGMSTATATALLHQQIPQQEIMQNRVYRPYRAAAALGGPGGVLPASSTPCSAERCYGAVAVNWSDAHRSCARSVRVGIIDTHVDLHHPTFEGRRISVGSFLSGAKPEAKAAHGTGVLALLAGRRDSGTPGLIPDAEFYAADVFFADASGNAMTDTVSMLKALDWLDASGVRIINMSVSGPPDNLVAKAISALAARGVIITAAAGNGGPAATASYPAAYPEVISITAVDRKNNAYRQANHGGYIDLAAPGVGVWTAHPGATEGPQTGTSFAVPFATAAIAAVYDNMEARTKEDVLNALSVADLGTPGRDTVFGRGLLQSPAPNCKPGNPGRDNDMPATASVANSAPQARAAAIAVEALPWAVPATGAPSAFGFTD